MRMHEDLEQDDAVRAGAFREYMGPLGHPGEFLRQALAGFCEIVGGFSARRVEPGGFREYFAILEPEPTPVFRLQMTDQRRL
jgi:hypothetical protein